jgi:addiction module HigA family antidote
LKVDVMAMRNPPHPGGIIRRQCVEALGLSVTEAAEGLGVTRQALSDLVNERAAVSVEMAVRLAKAFGSSPETWLGLQMAYDLAEAKARMAGVKVRTFKAA